MTGGPTLQPIGESLWVTWPGFTMEFGRIYDHRDSLSAEITVVDATEGFLHWARLNVASTPGRASVAKALEEASPTRPWREYVEKSCRMVVMHLRHAQPVEYLTPTAPNGHRWLVEPVIPYGEVTVLFGDGGTGKSLLALAVGLHGLLGHPMGAWHVGHVERMLYLDWETDSQTHRERLYGLTRTLEVPGPESILYRALARPLTDMMAVVRADADRHKPDLIICDSLAPACGPEPEGADAAVRTLMALRTLPGTKLVIAHVSKASAEQSRSRPFGSVYVQNIARSVIEVRRLESEDEEDSVTVSLYHRKSNSGRLAKAAAMAFTWGDCGQVTVHRASPDLNSATLGQQIADALLGGHSSVATLGKRLDASEATIRKELQRMKKRGKVIEVATDLPHNTKETLWGLLDSKRGNPNG